MHLTKRMFLITALLFIHCFDGYLQQPSESPCNTVDDFGPLKEIDGKVLYISENKEQYREAGRFCLRHNMTLVTIANKKENDDIYLIIKEEDNKHRFWISGSRFASDIFTHQNGTKLSYFNWSPGQPNGWYFEEGKLDENCIELSHICDGLAKCTPSHWNDEICDTQLHFICEKNKQEKLKSLC